MPPRALAHLIAVAAMSLAAASAHAAEVQVAVASNFAAPIKIIAADFERASGHRVRLSLGASGRFYAQVVSGAPFELLLSADAAVPERLAAEGLGVAATRRTYALGRLALWSADPARVDAQGRVLHDGAFSHLALANPKLAPYGAAAAQVLRALGLEDRLRARLVVAENIAQAHQFVASGNAELGFVAWSQIVAPGTADAGAAAGRLSGGSAWPVPPALHAPIRQDLVLLQRGARNPAAHALLAYLQSDAATAVIRAHGYTVPVAAAASAPAGPRTP